MLEKKEGKKVWDEKVSRRDFLKGAGKAAGGVAVGSSLMAVASCATGGASITGAFPVARGLVVQNRSMCTGCMRCETNCSLANQEGRVQPSVSGILATRNYAFGRSGPDIRFRNSRGGVLGDMRVMIDTCKQCRDPFCARACPAGAITADRANQYARSVDEDKCIGCGQCVPACPWGAINVSQDSGKAFKCINCGVCAEGCPHGALRLIPWQDVRDAMIANGLLKNKPATLA